MTQSQHQQIAVCIEEYTERLDLLEKTLQLEERQHRRLQDLATQKEKEEEEAKKKELFEGMTNSTLSMLGQEEVQRKELVEAMIQQSTPANGPVVKVLTNIQGN